MRRILDERYRGGITAALALGALFAAVLALSGATAPGPRAEEASVVAPAAVTATDGRYVFSELAENVMPSVVTVYVERTVTSRMSDEQRERMEQFRRFFDPFPFNPFQMPEGDGERPEIKVPATGSGVIVSDDGYVLTNQHVVGSPGEEGVEIRIVLYDGTEIASDAIELIESNELVDLALLKVDHEGLRPIAWGDSEGLRLGERVAAIGSPFRLQGTITQGIVCAKHRQVGGGLGDLIQTDAVINPGSSGGALVNLDGELIGINRLITTQTGAWQGYGFAIPAVDVKRYYEQVRETGKFANGFIGVTMGGPMQNSPEMREAMGLGKDREGVLIIDVRPDAPARRAGVQIGDFVVAADGQPVKNNLDLLGIVARKPVGSELDLDVLRPAADGKLVELTLSLEIAERPSEQELLADLRNGRRRPPSPDATPQPETEATLGMAVEPGERQGREGLVLTFVEPESPAAKAGLRRDDMLLTFNGAPVRDGEALRKAIAEHPAGRAHWTMFMREDQTQITTIAVE